MPTWNLNAYINSSPIARRGLTIGTGASVADIQAAVACMNTEYVQRGAQDYENRKPVLWNGCFQGFKLSSDVLATLWKANVI